MSRNRKDKADQALVTGEAAARFAMPDPVFVEGEDPTAYQSMLDQVRAAVKPSDFIEEAWVRDVVDLLWEAIRLKRMKSRFINAKTYNGLAAMLHPLVGRISYDLAERWLRNEQDVVHQVEKLLERAELTLEDARAVTVNTHIKTIDTFDRMIAGAEARRTTVLREIDRRRAAFALAMRLALKPVEEAEFTLVDQSRDQDNAG